MISVENQYQYLNTEWPDKRKKIAKPVPRAGYQPLKSNQLVIEKPKVFIDYDRGYGLEVDLNKMPNELQLLNRHLLSVRARYLSSESHITYGEASLFKVITILVAMLGSFFVFVSLSFLVVGGYSYAAIGAMGPASGGLVAAAYLYYKLRNSTIVD